MSAFSTFVRTSLTGGLLAMMASLTPAHAGPTTWSMTNASSCTFTNKSSFPGNGFTSSTGCVGDKPATSGNDGYDDVDGNIYSFTSGGNIIKAEAFHLATGKDPYASTSKLKRDFLGFYSGANYGLGVENFDAPEHAVDNHNGFDFVVFQLPTTAGTNYNQLAVSLSPWGTTHDTNVTIMWGSATAASGLGITGTDSFYDKTVAQLLTGGFKSMTTSGLLLENTIQTVTVGSTSAINYLIVAASLKPTVTPNEPDNFKISAITGANYTYHRCKRDSRDPSGWEQQPGRIVKCPEPASLAMFGVGLLGFGRFAMRRRKVAKPA